MWCHFNLTQAWKINIKAFQIIPLPFEIRYCARCESKKHRERYALCVQECERTVFKIPVEITLIWNQIAPSNGQENVMLSWEISCGHRSNASKLSLFISIYTFTYSMVWLKIFQLCVWVLSVLLSLTICCRLTCSQGADWNTPVWSITTWQIVSIYLEQHSICNNTDKHKSKLLFIYWCFFLLGYLVCLQKV